MDTIRIGLTGHRPNKLDGYNLSTVFYNEMIVQLKGILYEILKEDEDIIIEGHTGLALGADTIWTVCLLDIQAEYPPRVKIIAHIPNEKQADRWNKRDRQLWEDMRKVIDKEVIYSKEYPKVAWKGLMNKRNKGIVDNSDLILAIYDGSPSGTGNTVKYAEGKGKTVKIIEPKSFR